MRSIAGRSRVGFREFDKMLQELKSRARALKNEAYAVYLAAKDARTPWYAKALIFFVVAHTFSPIDLIPDFIPVLGYLDDLIITPGGLWLAVKLIPPEVLEEARRAAAGKELALSRSKGHERGVEYVGAALVILLWILVLVLLIKFLLR